MGTGYIHVYTGHGKGKTTAAIGLAIRAAGAGLRVLIAQFIKERQCSEHAALKRFSDLITIKQYGRGMFLKRKPGRADIAAARAGYEEVKEALRSKQFDMIILDEANVAVRCGLLALQDLLDIMAEKPGSVELVITGRDADKKVMKAADLVTEMREIKHYWKQGVRARRGIEK